ncbi:MAG: BamA/TamA family outer membrane protein [Pseudomonadota bacterium]
MIFVGALNVAIGALATAQSPPAPSDQAQTPDGPSKKTTKSRPKVIYAGAPKGMAAKFRILSALENDSNPFPTRASVRRAAIGDEKKFRGALTAAGFFDHEISWEITSTKPGVPEVTFAIAPGPAFRVTRHDVTYDDISEADRPSGFAALEINVSEAADGATLLSNQQQFLTKLWDNGFPTAKITGRRAIADFETGTATAQYAFTSGPKAFFGAAQLRGLSRTKEDYIRKLTTWEAGSVYDKSKTVDYRDALSATNLFSTIDVTPGPTGDDGRTPILVNVTERKHRTVGAGLSFSTNEGPGVRVFFENRNVFKRAETVRVDINVSQIEQSVAATFEKPLESLPGFVFGQGSFVNETTDAFDARTARIATGLVKTWLDERLETRGGLALELSRVIPNNGDPQEDNFFVSAPLSVVWNNEDSILNPTKGVLATLTVTPTAGTRTFTQLDTTARTRINFGPAKKFTAAVRGRVGSTVGISLDDLPQNKRFFSGGGGSVRGYGFQLAGPVDFARDETGTILRDEDGDITQVVPLGGRSIVEGAFEMRYRFTDTIQAAAFVDAGTVADTVVPNVSRDIFVGVGAGVRYFTPVGPLRVDIAVPLDRREFDAPVQFLISLGQSF